MPPEKSRMLCVVPAGAPFRVLGPAPAPLGRLKGEHRAQLFPEREANATRCARRYWPHSTLGRDLKRRAIVDVDPISVL